MRISRSTGYAIIAVGFIARNTERPTTLASEIARTYDIPLEYLHKLLQQLAKVDVLRSKRGPQGGFYLARKPDKISLLEIVEAVEGPISGPLHMAEQTKDEDFSVKVEKVCREAADASKAVLQKTTLAKMIKS